MRGAPAHLAATSGGRMSAEKRAQLDPYVSIAAGKTWPGSKDIATAVLRRAMQCTLSSTQANHNARGNNGAPLCAEDLDEEGPKAHLLEVLEKSCAGRSPALERANLVYDPADRY